LRTDVELELPGVEVDAVVVGKAEGEGGGGGSRRIACSAVSLLCTSAGEDTARTRALGLRDGDGES
jgi:hypothetical protein